MSTTESIYVKVLSTALLIMVNKKPEGFTVYIWLNNHGKSIQ